MAYRLRISDFTINDLVSGAATFLLMNLKLLWNLIYQSEAPWLSLCPLTFGDKNEDQIIDVVMINKKQQDRNMLGIELSQSFWFVIIHMSQSRQKSGGKKLKLFVSKAKTNIFF